MGASELLRRDTLAIMRLCLCEHTALQAWRHFDNRFADTPIFGHTPKAGPTLPKAFPSKLLPAENETELLSGNHSLVKRTDLSKWGLPDEKPLHLLVPFPKRGGGSNDIVLHSLSSSLPKGSLLRFDQSVSITSPEYSFVRSAVELDLVDLLLLGYELCGCYAIRPDLDHGLAQRHPLCSIDSIESYIHALGDIKGKASALKALHYLKDGSGSPRETALVLLLCLPMRYGGYGLPFPELNRSINLGNRGGFLWPKANAFDLVWENERLIIEYDGVADHSGEDARERDNRRRDALIAAGYTSIVVTKQQLNSIKDTYGIANATAKKLGKKLRFRDTDFRKKHLTLRERLLSPSAFAL